MGKFKNKQKISSIVFEPKEACHNLCPLGQLYCDEIAEEGEKPKLAHYTNNFKITMIPGDEICDYLDIEKWIRKNLNDMTLVIEDAVSMLYDYIKNEYNPKYLKVQSDVSDAVHGPVCVTKESR